MPHDYVLPLKINKRIFKWKKITHYFFASVLEIITHNNGSYLINWKNIPVLIFNLLSPSNIVVSKLSTQASDQIKDDINFP